MKHFQDLTIKNKLILIIVFVNLLSTGAGFTLVVINDLGIIKTMMLQNSSYLAELLSDFLVAPMAFEDRSGAGEILLKFKKLPAFSNAVVVDNQGRRFAAVQVSTDTIQLPLAGNHPSAVFQDNRLSVYHPIRFKGKQYGSLNLCFSDQLYRKIIKKYFLTMIALTVFLMGMACILAFHFQKIISRPILKLAAVTGNVSDAADYAIQVEKNGEDEIGVLIDGFNHMLRQIHHRQTEREIAESELRKLRNLLRNINDSMPSVIVGIDLKGRVTHWNREAEKHTGLSARQAQGRKLPSVMPGLILELARIRQAIQNREVVVKEKVPCCEAGNYRFSDITLYPLVGNGRQGAVLRIDDVTNRVRLEEMMIQTEKMMSVGGLAAGMAHEINNPLSGILQSIQNIQRRTSPGIGKNVAVAAECGTRLENIRCYLTSRDIYRFLENIRVSSERAAKIVANMLQFSRRSDSKKRILNLADLIDRTLELASSDYDLKKRYDFRHIQIRRAYDAALPGVPCVETEIEQVLLNLLKNAAQAMGGQSFPSGRPRIELRTRREGAMAVIEVADNGPGMPQHVRTRVFEPFFTTKDVGVGTGLGLSVSYFIIKNNHNGLMQVDAEEGRGTVFTIHLPLENI